MESYETVLAVGGKTNSLGRAQEVIDDVVRTPSRLDELFECTLAEDAWVRMRAIDTFEKIVRNNPSLGTSYVDRVITELGSSTQPSIQWHLAQLFIEVRLTAKQRAWVISWLKTRIQTIEVDWIVSVNAMKALMYFHERGYVDTGDLRKLLKIQETHPSKTVRKKALGFCESIKRGDYE